MNLDYDAYIFDCDGTLTDSMPLHCIAWERTMARHGIEFGRERCYAMAGMPTINIIKILASENKMTLDAATIAHEKEEAFFESIDLLKPIDHTLELVKRCQQAGKKMAVASGSQRHSVDLQLKQIGLDGTFEVIVTSEDTELHKPEPDVFLLAASRLNAKPGDCVVYEDADLGIEAARRAGMHWVDIRTVI